ncbi:uncharacterized protein LOC141611261 [Silene latifolia]|uniref:uncharacterized protein LOC141611261 n=1 Tax=Silene latifolia TaxID=37657 RepID=UPI003D783EAA
MAINYDWLINGDELLFKLFKKHSSKFMKIDWFAILKVFMIFICALFVIKVRLVVTLATAIVVCLSYLVVDILETQVDELVNKYKDLIKKLKERFVERNRIIHEANKVLLKEQKELLSRMNLLTKRLEIIIQEKKDLEKLVEEEKEKVSLLEDKCVEHFNCITSERTAYKEWRKQATTYRKQLEAEKVMLESALEQEVMRAEDLERDLEQQVMRAEDLERGLEQEVMRAEDLDRDLEDEMTERKRIEQEKEYLEVVLEEEQKEKDRLEKEVQKYKAMVDETNEVIKYLREDKERLEKEVQKYKTMVDETNEIIKYLQEDRDRNLNLKQVKEEMWTVIKSEIEKNAQCLSNELANLRGSIEKSQTERTEVLNAEEKCDTLKGHLKKMIKQLEKLEKERDKLVEENRVLSEQAKEDFENIVLNKFEGVMDVLSAHIVLNKERSEKMLENQDTLLNLLSESKSRSEGEVSSDDGYEVVE